MNQNSKNLLRQFGLFILFALVLSAACVIVSFSSHERRNRLLCSAVETAVLRIDTKTSFVRISDCRKVPDIPGVTYIEFSDASGATVYGVWMTVNGFAGPELPLFLVPALSKRYADILYCGNLAANSLADSGLTSAAILGCKKRLLRFLNVQPLLSIEQSDTNGGAQ